MDIPQNRKPRVTQRGLTEALRGVGGWGLRRASITLVNPASQSSSSKNNQRSAERSRHPSAPATHSACLHPLGMRLMVVYERGEIPSGQCK
jgi:hypothetical protein